MKFPLGQIVATPAALAFLEQHHMTAITYITRHAAGDWGDVDRHDRLANEHALNDGSRIFSVYKIGADKIWIITEADRSSTCVMLPEDY